MIHVLVAPDRTRFKNCRAAFGTEFHAENGDPRLYDSNMLDQNTARIETIERIIPRPQCDVAPMRAAFSRLVSKQWQTHVSPKLDYGSDPNPEFPFAKGRFIGEMYARACYSMLLVGASAPAVIRLPIRASALLPQSRRLMIKLGSVLLAGMEQLLPAAVHRQLLLTSAFMGMLDIVLDDVAASGEAAAFRVALLLDCPTPARLSPAEQMTVTLSGSAREGETAWQT